MKSHRLTLGGIDFGRKMPNASFALSGPKNGRKMPNDFFW